MNDHAHMKAIFQHINAMIWNEMDRPYASSTLKMMGHESMIQRKEQLIGRKADAIQNIIAAYIEKQTAMMQDLIAESRFSRFPLPDRKIRLWTRLQARIELWKAIHSSLSSEQQDFEQS